MKIESKWFTTGMGLFTILCTLAVAPASEGKLMVFSVGNKTGDIGTAPQSRVPDEKPDNQSKLLSGAFSNRNGVLQREAEETAEDIDTTEDQDPLETILIK